MSPHKLFDNSQWRDFTFIFNLVQLMTYLIDLTGHLCLTLTLLFSPAERMLSQFLRFHLSDSFYFYPFILLIV